MAEDDIISLQVRNYWRCVLTTGCVLVWVSAGAVAAESARRAERLTYDAKADLWVRSPEPMAGTEDGDLDIARKLLAREDYEAGLKALKQWVKVYGPMSPRYSEALYLKGSAHLELGEYRAANDAYDAILKDFPGSDYAEPSLSGEFRIAEQYLAGKRRRAWGGLLRVKDRDGGIAILDDLILNYPDTPFAELAQRSKADYYYARGEFELAADEYATFVREYPRSRFHPYALLQNARSALASFPGVQFDDAGLVESQELFKQFNKLYPAQADELQVPVVLEEISARRAEKTLEIAKFYNKTKKIQAARYYYRATMDRWPDTPAAAEAGGRLAALGAPLVQIDEQGK